eukprot:64104_1
MLLSDNTGVKHTRSGVKRIDSGVNSQLGNGTGKHSGGIQVSKGGGGGRIGKIIGRYVYGLYGGNGSLSGRGNTLLKGSHISGKGGLVSYSGRNTSKKGRYLRSGLGETENVVDEEQHILSLLVTEVLGNGESGKGDTGTGTWGLVHLSVHKGSLGSLGGATGLIDLDDTSLNHLVVKIVTLTSTLSDTSEDRVSSVVHGNVVNKFHNNNGLSYSGSSEETNLTSLGVRGKKIDNLDSGDEDILCLSLLAKGRSRSVKRSPLLIGLLDKDGSLLIHGLSDDIDNTSQSQGSNRNLNGGSGINTLLSTDKSVSGLHGNGTDGVLSKMLGHLEDKTLISLSYLYLKGIQNLGELLVELYIHNGSNDLGYLSGTHLAYPTTGSSDNLSSGQHGSNQSSVWV